MNERSGEELTLTSIDNSQNPLVVYRERDSSRGFSGPNDVYDTIPSYETSQWLHEQQQREQEASTSLPASTNISANSSIATGVNRLSEGVLSMSVPTSMAHTRKAEIKRSLKQIGLKSLNARQHFALACSRDLSLIPCFIGLLQSWKRVFAPDATTRTQILHSVTSARASEHFLTGLWCIVSAYLSYSVLDGLMIRWIVEYLTTAAIVRMLSMSAIIVSTEQYLLATFSADGYKYGLHIWILISCCLTLTYIVQNFVTSNLDLKGKRRARFFDFYNIAVFAVVPVGIASFITMIGLLRSLLILRLDIDQNGLS